MGRDSNNDIHVLDTKSSRKHVEIVLINDDCILTDLGAQNGVLVNNKKIKQHKLIDNDKFIIGSTVYKYNRIQVKKKDLSIVEEEEGDDLEDSLQDENKKKDGKMDGGKRRLYLILAVLGGAYFLLDDGGNKKISKRNIVKEEVVLDNTLDFKNDDFSSLDEVTKEKLKIALHRGRRELREQNFFRAIEQFNLALIISPRSGQASFLLKRTQQRLDEFIKKVERKAVNEVDQKRYRAALLRWCEIIRYLKRYPEDERYINAENQIGFLEKKVGYEDGEYKCF